MATPNGNGRLITGINVTPLVDVTLVLLVIMMVTASYIVAQSIPVDLPRASSGEAASSPLVVTLDRERRLHLGSETLSELELRARIRSAHVGDREVRAVISADGALPHRDVIHVVDVLRQEGVTRFAINVEPDPVSLRAK